MKFLKEEKIVLLLFIAVLAIVVGLVYFTINLAPKIKTVVDSCEVGCPIYAPCHPDCVKAK